MTLTTPRSLESSPRDPANELYDRACDLLAAATELRRAAARDNNEAAVAATLNCLEAALEETAVAVDLLRDGSLRRIAAAWPILGDDAARAARRVFHRFVDAREGVRGAARRCGDLRGAVGPLLAELTL
jgi:hypothetical protein